MPVKYVIIALTAFFSVQLFIFLFKRFVAEYNLLVSKGMPLVGGIAMGLGFILASMSGFLLCGGVSRKVVGILTASSLMLILGLFDDERELSIPAKLSIQVISTSILIFLGVRTHIVYIGTPANLIITFIWVLGITNVFNLLDILDGLASGVAVIVSAAFFATAFLINDPAIAVISFALMIATLSFFLRNLPPAKVYMGNSGSHFLGFLLAAIAISISYAPMDRKAALLAPLLILGFPILDTAFLVFVRMKKKRPVFRKSEDHLALRFLKMGHSKKNTLIAMLVLTALFSFSGFLVSQLPNNLGLIVVASVILLSGFIGYRMGRVSIGD